MTKIYETYLNKRQLSPNFSAQAALSIIRAQQMSVNLPEMVFNDTCAGDIHASLSFKY